MPKSPVRIAIDTNLWVGYVLSHFKSQLRVILEDENVEIITSTELTHEIFEVLSRQKFREKISHGTISVFRELYEQSVLSIDTVSIVHVCRDPKDDFLLALALDGALDFLLTLDDDLLVLNPYGQTQILKITEYLVRSY
jgi:putative PIN family toxin of toxin-antitoxin system